MTGFVWDYPRRTGEKGWGHGFDKRKENFDDSRDQECDYGKNPKSEESKMLKFYEI